MMGLSNECTEEAEMLMMKKEKFFESLQAGKGIKTNTFINNQVLLVYRTIWGSLFLNYLFHK